jgi:argininosuccinate lyase
MREGTEEAVSDATDTLTACLEVSTTVLRNLRLNEARTREVASRGYMNATELADYLVRKGMPFREAHETVGRLVVHSIDQGCELQELPIASLRRFSQLIEEDVYQALSLENTVNTKAQTGGTSPDRVKESLVVARASLLS